MIQHYLINKIKYIQNIKHRIVYSMFLFLKRKLNMENKKTLDENSYIKKKNFMDKVKLTISLPKITINLGVLKNKRKFRIVYIKQKNRRSNSHRNHISH